MSSSLRIAFLVFAFISFGCKVTCAQNDYDYVISTLKYDYPSFTDKCKMIDFDSLISKSFDEYPSDTFKALSKIVTFFNDPHLSLYEPGQEGIKHSLPRPSSRTIIDNLQKSNNISGFAGFWINDYNNCIINIKRSPVNANHYEGFVVETNSNAIYKGQKILSLEPINAAQYFTDFISPFTGSRQCVISNFRNDTIFTTSSSAKWKKLNFYKPNTLKSFAPYDFLASGIKINSNAYLLKIPECSKKNALEVKKIMKRDYEVISNSKNLILDIRNNIGGTVEVYDSILPFIYTNPIVRVQGYHYCSIGHIRKSTNELAEYLKRGKRDSLVVKEWINELKLEADSIGHFLLGPADTLIIEEIKNNPRNVGVIINYACQSAAEMLLLDFLQSSKVTLFGEHTRGAVDNLDSYYTTVPSGKFRIYVPMTTRALKNKNEKVDGIGIFPKVHITDDQSDWVQFVVKYYEGF